jgi:ABC-type glycerol-3-phosphate transport system substrate-binding protein
MYWGDTVSSECEYPTVAWDFIKFLTTKQEEIFSASSQIRAFGEPYSFVNLNTQLESNTYLKAYATMAPYMRSWSMGDQGFVETTINTAIKEIIQDGEDIESAFSNAQADINDQLAQSNK